MLFRSVSQSRYLVALVGGSADVFVGSRGYIVHVSDDGSYGMDYPITITKSKDGVVGALISLKFSSSSSVLSLLHSFALYKSSNEIDVPSLYNIVASFLRLLSQSSNSTVFLSSFILPIFSVICSLVFFRF